MIKFMLGSLSCLAFLASCVVAQESGPVRCVMTLYRQSGETWKLSRSLEFSPKMAEEELTSRIIRLTGGRMLVASVFPTDESMHSGKGFDSIRLGLGTTRNARFDAFQISNNAVAEVTLGSLDTVRVERTVYLNRRRVLTRLECWDANLQKKLANKD